MKRRCFALVAERIFGQEKLTEYTIEDFPVLRVHQR